MREIRPLTLDDLDTAVTIIANAYPGIGVRSEADRERLRIRQEALLADADVHMLGLFEQAELVGVMKLYDYRMKLLSAEIPVGGVGGVAVDLRHKKQKVARDMVHYFLRHYHERSVPLTALYPFRPDFYRRMGFGYGSRMNVYRIRPSDLPDRGDKTAVDFVAIDERQALVACYERLRAQTNGLFALTNQDVTRLLETPGQHVVGVRDGRDLRGYAVWRFEKQPHDNFLDNDIVVQWLVAEDTAALLSLLAFFRSQVDQVRRVIIHSQDDQLYFLFQDPRRGSTPLIPPVYHECQVQGLGIMYRVIDVAGLLAALSGHHFNDQTITLRLRLRDSFWPQNENEQVVVWRNGRCHIDGSAAADSTLVLDVSDFSSLITGAVEFDALWRYGLAELSHPETAVVVNRLFQAPRPLCMTAF